ncbi:MAG: hypothetical protein HDQ87_03690 [Clostridia bacterium]|nr:hypothetical protein [Clostridia bacterium]
MKRLFVLALCFVLTLCIVSCNQQNADPAVSQAERFNLASGYDMEGEKGSWVLITDHFRLKLPEDLEQYELQVDQPDYDTLEFSYWYPTSEYRGESVPLFTLTASENGEDLAGWTVVGEDERHRYAVAFAEDGEPAAAQAERYAELQEFFRGMDPEGGQGGLIEIME